MNPEQTILVGDIGSTKSSWWISGPDPMAINLAGYNPVVHAAEIGKEMMKCLSIELKGLLPNVIWYYGTGVIDQEAEHHVKVLLKEIFPTSNLHVNTDLKGAALATCGNAEGTVIILGTGSHVAVFDGHDIIRQANSLGYMLGDEGGGCDIGKSLLQAYFYEMMPEEVKLNMQNYLPEGRAAFLKELYSSPVPNQFLATFAQVAVEMQENDWIQELVRTRFRLLIKNHLLPLKPVTPIHILGSIGCIFADLIENELNTHALQAGIFLKDPSYRLFTMHTNNGIEKE